ncbi:FG-GAP repeat domain-containing protein [Bacteroidota bacterium]
MIRIFFLLITISTLYLDNLEAQTLYVDQWTYIQVDDNKAKWGDTSDPQWLRYFGVDMGDLDNDGDKDILTGRFVYLNPGGDMTSSWDKIDFGINVDGILVMDVDGDEFADVIGQALPDIYWLEATDNSGKIWKPLKVGEVPATSHVNSQGFEKAQLVSGGQNEFVIAGAGNIYCFEVPEKPEKGSWKSTLICANTSDEGIGTGDIDGDGDIDIAAGRRPENEGEPLIIVWFENPGLVTREWKNVEIGNSNHPIDRVEIADINGDGTSDVIISEERYPGKEPDGNLFWYEQPDDPSSTKWERHRVVTQYSMNNLDIGDIDNDGDTDLVTNEHKGPHLETQIWINDGKGNFKKVSVDTGKESHLGTQLADMDNDGDLEIVSIGWDKYKFVHLWRNDGIHPDIFKWKHYSTVNGDMDVPNEGGQQTAALVLDIDKDGINDFVITERTSTPSVTWYKFNNYKWDRYIIDDGPLRIEAGSTHFDIDNDGDEDIVFGGESQSNEVWWWENPYPKYNKSWKRHTIKSSGENKHHDQLFGDYDGDGKEELVFWNQNATRLYLAEIPENPRKVDSWPLSVVYEYTDDSQPAQLGQEGYPGWKGVNEHEGLAKADIDGDGVLDIIGGGRWFKYNDSRGFIENLVDPTYTFTRSGVGDFVKGGRPEIILIVGDGTAPMMMYEWTEGTWESKVILESLDNGHTLHIGDYNRDGFDDIFTAEMRFGEGNPDAKAQILLSDGKGNFRKSLICEGFGNHESWISDLDGDGDFDVLGKPYSWKAPRLDIWINEGN